MKTDKELIAEYLAKHGATQCPPGYAFGYNPNQQWEDRQALFSEIEYSDWIHEPSEPTPNERKLKSMLWFSRFRSRAKVPLNG